MGQAYEQASSIASWVQSHALQFNFYRAHLIFFVVTILVSSAIFWGSNTNGFRVSYTNSLFMCASAMTNCGLTTIDLSQINAYQQSILFALMAFGDLSIASISVVIVRRYFFGRKIRSLLQHSKAARRLVADIEEQRHSRISASAEGQSSSSSSSVNDPPCQVDIESHIGRSAASQAKNIEQHSPSSKNIKPRLPWAHSGYGGLPAPWEVDMFRRVASFPARKSNQTPASLPKYVSFPPQLDERGNFHNLTSAQLEELGGVEFRALGVLMWLLPAYSLVWLCVSLIVIVPYTVKTSIAATIRDAQPGDTNPQWWAVFTSLSAYTNSGLNLLDQNMIPLRRDYLILIFIGATVLGGNTFYPIFLRLTIRTMSKIVPKDSQLHHSLTFLLQHPRRCFWFLFPAKNTWYLLVVQILIFLLVWWAFGILNLGYQSLTSDIPDMGQRVMNGLFQTLGVRSSGFYITNQSNLSPSCQIFFMVNMYISAIPFIVSLRSSNVYEDRSIGVDNDKEKDPDQSKSGMRNRHNNKGINVQMHLKTQLAYDLWWIVLAVWLVTIIERDQLSGSAPGFNLFSIIFEVVSAYGTVGLSLGLPNANLSFCGAWGTLSRLILVTVMLRGRHRILPLAVDRAVLIPGQDLMEQLDREDTSNITQRQHATRRNGENHA